MGNDTSKPSNRMAVSALAHMMRITKPQLLALRDTCLFVSEKGEDVDTPSGYRLTREKFLDAMTVMQVAMEPDYQVLEKLFVMHDRNGRGWVDPLEFFAGIGPLASVMDVKTKLKFSLEVYDYKKSGRISREDLVTVLEAINATSSYFGDAVLQRNQVAVIVDDLFANEIMLEDGNAIAYSDKVYKMTNHPLVTEFTSGSGSARYGTAQ
ncbi:hypothetical protein ACHAXR_001666 [Thalassiosira sp. AJA248-18]